MFPFLRAAVFSAAFLHSLTGHALAEDVTLRARSGGMEIAGRLVAFDGETYRIDSRWGRVTVEASAVDCDGPGCPELQSFAPELRIMAEPAIADQILRPMIENWAGQEGLALHQTGARTSLVAPGGQAQLHILRLDPAEDLATALDAGDADGALVLPPPAQSRAPGRPVARVPLVLASGPEAPPGGLSRRGLQEVRASEAPSWRPLTGVERPLVWHSSGTFSDLALEQSFGPTRFMPRRPEDPADLVRDLIRDPWGLALLPAPLPPGLIERQVIESCGLIRDASLFALAAGEHPHALTVHWRSAGRRLPAQARRFLDFMNEQPQAGLNITTALPLSAQGARLANALLVQNPEVQLSDLQRAIARLSEARRLPLTIRFDRTGAADGEGRAALAALEQIAAAGQFQGWDLLFAGFTDSNGSARANLEQAQTRAEAMRAAVQKLLPPDGPQPRLYAEGFGEIMPIACEDSPEGRHLNRRVELWLLPAR